MSVRAGTDPMRLGHSINRHISKPDLRIDSIEDLLIHPCVTAVPVSFVQELE